MRYSKLKNKLPKPIDFNTLSVEILKYPASGGAEAKERSIMPYNEFSARALEDHDLSLCSQLLNNKKHKANRMILDIDTWHLERYRLIKK